MGIRSLMDLKLSGVKWELSETTTLNTEKKDSDVTKTVINQDTSTKNTEKIAVIPAIAPISVSMAKNIADGSKDLQSLCDAILNFNHPLRQFVKNVVLPHFPNQNGGLLIITDAPSTEDNEKGLVLTGNTGDLMNKMLSAINLNRESVSVIPMIFWRTPGGRTPSTEELELSKPFVIRAIELLKPSAILTLGISTAKSIANAKLPDNHGDIIQNEFGSIIPIYHPNYLLLKPDAKREVWEALQKLEKLLKNTTI